MTEGVREEVAEEVAPAGESSQFRNGIIIDVTMVFVVSLHPDKYC